MPTLRLDLLALFVLALAVGTASRARAQMTVAFTSYGDRGTPASGASNYLVNWPISRAECEANTPIGLQLTGAPFSATMPLVWDLWQGGTGTSGANCETPENRRATATGAAVCARRDWTGGQVTSALPRVEIRPQTLFPGGCGSATQGTFVFYLLAVSAQNDTTTTLANTHFVSFTVALDTSAPGAPTATDGAGDRAIQVRWTNPAEVTLSSARVYVDTTADCDTASTTLIAGSAPPSSLSPAATTTGSAPTSATLDGEALGLEIGESARVGVTILDLARNESVLSNIVCIERVPVSGYWARYCAEQGLDTDACSERYGGCGVSPRRGHTPFVALVVLGLVALGRHSRRSKRGGR